MIRFRMLVAVILLTWASKALAEGASSRITGKVRSGGKPLSGVAVTVTSKQLLGRRITATAADGAWVVDALPPGMYAVEFRHHGMQTLTRMAVLQLGQTTITNAELQPSEEEESVTSTARKETVLATPLIATTLQPDFIEKMPVSRDVGSRAGLLASTQLVQVSGGFIGKLDGGLMTAPFVEDAIDQTTLLYAAIPAEYGSFNDGVILVSTRPGGEEFSGSLRTTATSAAWSARSRFARDPLHRDTIDFSTEETGGGPVVRERVWFFAGARYEDTASPIGSSVFAPLRDSSEMLRLDVLPAEQHSLSLLLGHAALNDGYTDHSPTVTTLHYSGVLDGRFTLEGLVSQAEDRDRSGTSIPQFEGRFRGRNTSLEASYALGSGRLGLQELSAGVQTNGFGYPGSRLTPQTSFFVVDRWTPGSRWSLDAGARYDSIKDGFSHVSPRIGAVYDLRADGRARVSANFAQYFTSEGDERFPGRAVVNESSLGYGFQIGSEGSGRIVFLRRRLIDGFRYRGEFEEHGRTMTAAILDGGYRLFGLAQLGGSYGWRRGGGIGYGTEGLGHSRQVANAWIQADIPMSPGQLNVSLLERYGSPFDEDSPFGVVRTQALQSTDLAATWAVPVGPVSVSVKPEILNIFNAQPASRTVERPDWAIQPTRSFRITAAVRF